MIDRDFVHRLAVTTGYSALIGALWATAWLGLFRLQTSTVWAVPLEFAGTWLSEVSATAAIFGGCGLLCALTVGTFIATRPNVSRFAEVWGRGPRAVDSAPMIGLATFVGGVLLILPRMLDAVLVGGMEREFLRVGGVLMAAIVVMGGFGRAFRRSDVDEGRGPRLLLLAPPLLLFGLCLTALAPRPGGRGGVAGVEARPNVLLITIDGLPVGLPDDVQPTIAGLARRGSSFEQAVTPFPSRVPAAAAMLTGLHPLQMQVGGERSKVPNGSEGLAELLSADGYSTAAFVSSTVYLRETRLDRGFEVYDEGLEDRVAEALRLPTRRLSRRVRQALGHYDPLTMAGRRDESSVERFEQWLAVHGRSTWFVWVALNGPSRPADEPIASRVALADSQVRALLDKVSRFSSLERTVVVVTAPFGSATDGAIGEAVVRVPMLVAGPGVPRSTIQAQVRLQDLQPTIIGLTGRRMASGIADGKDLLPYMRNPEAPSIQALILAAASDGYWVALRQSTWKFVRGPDAAEVLLRLSSDGGPPREVSADYPDELLAARTGLAGLLQGAVPVFDPPNLAFWERDRLLDALAASKAGGSDN